jgi:hypothetical protein
MTAGIHGDDEDMKAVIPPGEITAAVYRPLTAVLPYHLAKQYLFCLEMQLTMKFMKVIQV